MWLYKHCCQNIRHFPQNIRSGNTVDRQLIRDELQSHVFASGCRHTVMFHHPFLVFVVTSVLHNEAYNVEFLG